MVHLPEAGSREVDRQVCTVWISSEVAGGRPSWQERSNRREQWSIGSKLAHSGACNDPACWCCAPEGALLRRGAIPAPAVLSNVLLSRAVTICTMFANPCFPPLLGKHALPRRTAPLSLGYLQLCRCVMIPPCTNRPYPGLQQPSGSAANREFR
jgi:hypothetical protein